MPNIGLESVEFRSQIVDVPRRDGTATPLLVSPVWQRRFKNLWDVVQGLNTAPVATTSPLTLTTINIPHVDLITIPTLPNGYTLFPAPAAGKAIIPIAATFQLRVFDFMDYTNVDSACDLYIGYPTERTMSGFGQVQSRDVLDNGNGFLNAMVAGGLSPAELSTPLTNITVSHVDGAPLRLFLANGVPSLDLTGGDARNFLLVNVLHMTINLA